MEKSLAYEKESIKNRRNSKNKRKANRNNGEDVDDMLPPSLNLKLERVAKA